MSFDSLLNKRCDIQKKTRGYDTYGQPQDTWPVVAPAVNCRIDERGGGLVEVETEVYEAGRYVMFMRKPAGIDLDTDNYRIVLEGIIYKIIKVGIFYRDEPLSHLEIILEKIA